MKTLLLDYFRRLTPLSEEEASAIEQSMLVRSFPKGALLLEAGQVSTSAYFVLKGCIRQYSLVDGEEHTLGFFIENHWVVSLKSMLRQTPSEHFLVCAEDTTVVVGDQQREEELFQTSPRLQAVSRLVVQQLLAEEQARLEQYVSATPEERYVTLRAQRPELFDRVPLYQIASYVGIRPESLSRIRRRLSDSARTKR